MDIDEEASVDTFETLPNDCPVLQLPPSYSIENNDTGTSTENPNEKFPEDVTEIDVHKETEQPAKYSPLDAFLSISRVKSEVVRKNSDSSEINNDQNDSVSDSVVSSNEQATDVLSTGSASIVDDDVDNCRATVLPNWANSSPNLIAKAEKVYLSGRLPFAGDNYLRGCKWAPDGSCLLTNSRDNVLRLFNLPNILLNPDQSNEGVEDMHAVLSMSEPELVYDCAWYPAMTSSDPTTCCFASTVRRNPIRLWDAFSGTVRATYIPMNHLGELVSAYSVAFSADGLKLYCGFNRFMKVFDLCRPGRDSMRRPKLGKKSSQGGIISCIAVPREPDRQIYATGSYNGSVALYSEPGNLLSMAYASPAGVTQLSFGNRFGKESGAPWYLIAGGRMDSRIFVWDARSMSDPLLILHRRVENHQRFQFDLDPTGRYLFTGSQTGVVHLYDLHEATKETTSSCLNPAMTWRAHADCTHGLSVHPSLPVVATTSGQRRIRPPSYLLHRKVDTVQTTTTTSGSAEEEFTDSDEDLVNLTDNDATTLGDLTDPVNRQSFPFSGLLTRLPRQNCLSLWSFPLNYID